MSRKISEETLGQKQDIENRSTSKQSQEYIASLNNTEQPLSLCENDRLETYTSGIKDEANLAGNQLGTSPAPDGGMTAWFVVLGAWCTSFCSFGWINSIGTFQDYYETNLLSNFSASEIAWIPSLQIFFMFAMGPIVGKIHDSYGPRYLLLGGSFLHVFGLMMASISTEYYQVMLSQGVCSAIGVSAIFQPALSCVGVWFDKNRGAAFGILATGSSVGGVIFPIMISHLIRTVSYEWAMRISAFLIFLLLIIANLTVKARFPPSPKPISKPELKAPFAEIGFLLLAFGTFLFTFGMFIPVTYLVVEAVSGGMSIDLAHYLVAIYNAASLFGRLGSGFLADKAGRYNVFIAASCASGIVVLALWLPGTSDAAKISFSILFGFFSGSYVSLLPALVAQISPLRTIGYRTGLVFLGSSLPGLTTGPIAGHILIHSGGWDGAKIFAGVFCVAGTSFVLWARFHFTGPKLCTIF